MTLSKETRNNQAQQQEATTAFPGCVTPIVREEELPSKKRCPAHLIQREFKWLVFSFAETAEEENNVEVFVEKCLWMFAKEFRMSKEAAERFMRQLATPESQARIKTIRQDDEWRELETDVFKKAPQKPKKRGVITTHPAYHIFKEWSYTKEKEEIDRLKLWDNPRNRQRDFEQQIENDMDYEARRPVERLWRQCKDHIHHLEQTIDHNPLFRRES